MRSYTWSQGRHFKKDKDDWNLFVEDQTERLRNCPYSFTPLTHIKRLVRDISTVFICLSGTKERETRFILWLHWEVRLEPVGGRYREISNPSASKN